LGLKDIATRRGRALTNVMGVAFAVTMAVPIAGIGTATATPQPSAPRAGAAEIPADATDILALPAMPAAINSEIAQRIGTLITTMELLLGAIAIIMLLAAAAMSMRERIRELGVLHALGCTTPQLVGASAVSHGAIGAVGALIGLPPGAGLYLGLLGLGTGNAAGIPPTSAIALPAIAAILIAAAAGAAPATRTAFPGKRCPGRGVG
jgi:ABC-type antimicrobial peptide transport system permease subunit